jgi:hypothetical protein
MREKVKGLMRNQSRAAFLAAVSDFHAMNISERLDEHIKKLGENPFDKGEWIEMMESVYEAPGKLGTRHFPRGYALITRAVARNSTEFNSARAVAALQKEVDGLLEKKCFDWNYVREASEVRKQFPDAVFVRLHPVMVVKGTELGPELEKYKARVVAGGNQILDAQGKKASPDAEMGYVLPPGLGGVRLVVAYGHSVKGGGVSMADVDAAYVQARLGGPTMWARSDPLLRPRGLRGFYDPVVPLWGALYGIPRAGWDWDQHAENVFVSLLGWKKTEDAEGSTYYRGLLLMTVYIDDIVIGGDLILAAS